MKQTIESLLAPSRLYTRAEILARPCPVPQERGIYAWYFRRPPSPTVLVDGCATHDGCHLLYVGISPSAPRGRNGLPSKATVRTRLRAHLRGNASRSTLRFSLGVLLSPTLGLELRRAGRTGRMTFHAGESILSDWLEENARVAWAIHETPWTVEERAVEELDLPLNLDMNRNHRFHPILTEARAAARARARALPILG